jgi:hypothetical protein
MLNVPPLASEPVAARPPGAAPKPGFYATEPHQPTYQTRLPTQDQSDGYGSLLDLRPPPLADGGRGRNDVEHRPRAVAGLTALVLLAAGAVLAATSLHHDTVATTGASADPTAVRSAGPTRVVARSPGQIAASAIDAAMTRSEVARKLSGPAYARTRACRASTADVSALTSGATTRTGLVTGLGRVDVRALPGGAAVVAELGQAFTYSARADLAYAAWARNHLSCTGHATTSGSTDWERAHRDDAQAKAARARAVALWNPLARR